MQLVTGFTNSKHLHVTYVVGGVDLLSEVVAEEGNLL
jgi:hypothetical protein